MQVLTTARGPSDQVRYDAATVGSGLACMCSPRRPPSSPQVRYDAATVGSACRVKFMTDGVLLRELQSDLTLSRYSCLILDEAHERGVNTDLLLGLLSRVVLLRRTHASQHAAAAGGQLAPGTAPPGPLKLVIMSATLQVDSFRANPRLFPEPPPVLKVDARQFPVTTHFSRTTPEDHLVAAFQKVTQIHARLPPGGILIFLTGQAEIEALISRLTRHYARAASRRASAAARQAQAKAAAAAASGEAAAEEAAAAAGVAVVEVEVEEAQRAAAAGMAAVARLEADEQRNSEGWLLGEEAEAAEDAFESPLPKRVAPKEAPKTALKEALAAAGRKETAVDEQGEGEEGEDEETEVGGPVLILPLYSMLPASEQMRVWTPPPEGTRLIVVATNVAETSITIPHITYVVDCGKFKQRTFSESSAVSRFELEWISQASADQRAGRAGRSGPGHCYRLYSSSVFSNIFPRFAEPEIRRAPVEGLVLQMKAMGITRVATFPFPEPPSLEAVHAAELSLAALGAIASPPGAAHAAAAHAAHAAHAAAAHAAAAHDGASGPEGSTDVAPVTAPACIDLPVTALGRLLARLPIAPRLGKLLLVCRRDGLLRHGLALTAMLAQQDPYVFSRAPAHDDATSGMSFGNDGNGEDEEDVGHEGGAHHGIVRSSMTAAEAAAHDARVASLPPRWVCAHSDALSLLGAYVQWRQAGADEAAARLCGLVFKVMREAEQLEAQLIKLLIGIFPDDTSLVALASDRVVASASTAGGDAAEGAPAVAAATALAPLAAPDETQATALRRALVSASPDRVARLAALSDAPADRAVLAAALKEMVPSQLRRAYLGASHASGRLLWLPLKTALGQLKPRPSYVAFLEVSADGKRPRLVHATAIDPAWLVEAAPSLTKLGEPVLELPPRYEPVPDTTLCWRTPTYLGRAVSWTLPAVPRPPPPSPPWLAPALFGRALCAGHVLKPLRGLAEAFEPRARLLTSEATTDRAVLALRAVLSTAGLVSLHALVEAWARDARCLLKPLLTLLDSSRRAELVELWPRLLLAAERADTKRRLSV